MRRSFTFVVFAALAVAGVATGIFVTGSDARPVRSDATIRITVTASEFKYVFSRRSVPVGTTVIFKVVNKGKIDHDFKISGKKTPILKPGKAALLKVVFKKKGQFAYLCTVPGHAAAGMKGKFAVGTAPAAPPTTTTPAATPPPAPTPPAPGNEPLGGDPAAGKAIFLSSGCGSCHTLAAAGSSGTIGPNLDLAKPGQDTVKRIVPTGSTSGGSSMPGFSISGTNLDNLAAFVYASTH
jgi:uncharacterized cupredoxin-like copper-binding protein